MFGARIAGVPLCPVDMFRYENPHDAEFKWVYDERLRRRVREYTTWWRPIVKAVFLPLAFFFVIMAMVDQTLFAMWGAHQVRAIQEKRRIP